MQRLNRVIAGALLAVAVAVSCLGAAEIAPDFALKDVNGNTVTFASVRGKVVFIDFWASWCPPCRKSIPAVEALYKKYAGKNVAVLGINVENDPVATKRFAATMNITYPVLIADQKTTRAYKVGGIPAFFVIRPDGTIAKKFVGFTPGTESEWEQEINTQLETARPETSANPSKGQKKSPTK